MNFISTTAKIRGIAATTTAGTSTVTSSAIDMAGFETAEALAKFGTAAADNTLKAQQSDDDGVADAYSDLAGTLVGVGASDEYVWLAVKPTKRYVKFLALRGTSSTLDDLVAFQGGAREMPVDNTIAGTIHGEAHAWPAEGTA